MNKDQIPFALRGLLIDSAMRALEDDISTTIGWCTSCGEEADGCEPDAREYHCESCEQNTVYGSQEILMMLA